MAKSLRSKWVRKCKREKRKRYGKKELASLVSLVEKASKNDVVIRDAAEVVRETAQKIEPTKQAEENSMDAEMTSSSTPNEPVPRLKTIIKQTGTAPKWLHPRRLKRGQKNQKKKAKAGPNKNKFLG